MKYSKYFDVSDAVPARKFLQRKVLAVTSQSILVLFLFESLSGQRILQPEPCDFRQLGILVGSHVTKHITTSCGVR